MRMIIITSVGVQCKFKFNLVTNKQIKTEGANLDFVCIRGRFLSHTLFLCDGVVRRRKHMPHIIN